MLVASVFFDHDERANKWTNVLKFSSKNYDYPI